MRLGGLASYSVLFATGSWLYGNLCSAALLGAMALLVANGISISRLEAAPTKNFGVFARPLRNAAMTDLWKQDLRRRYEVGGLFDFDLDRVRSRGEYGSGHVKKPSR